MSDWARALVGKWVVHVPTQVVGHAERFFDGVEERAKSTLTGEEVAWPVLQVGGSTFVTTKEEDFRALEEHEVQLFAAVQAFVADITRECARMSVAMRVGSALAVPLIASALRAQAREIERSQRSHEVPA